MSEEEKDKKINFRIFTAEDLLSNQPSQETKQIAQKEDEINIELIGKIEPQVSVSDVKNLPQKEIIKKVEPVKETSVESGVINFSQDSPVSFNETSYSSFEKESGLISSNLLSPEIQVSTSSFEKESGLVSPDILSQPIQNETSFSSLKNEQPEVYQEAGVLSVPLPLEKQEEIPLESELETKESQKEIKPEDSLKEKKIEEVGSFKPLIEPSFVLNKEINQISSSGSQKINLNFFALKKLLLPISLSLIVLFVFIFKPYQKLNFTFVLFKKESSKLEANSEFEKPILPPLVDKFKNKNPESKLTLNVSTLSVSTGALAENQKDEDKNNKTYDQTFNQDSTSSLPLTNFSTITYKTYTTSTSTIETPTFSTSTLQTQNQTPSKKNPSATKTESEIATKTEILVSTKTEIDISTKTQAATSVFSTSSQPTSSLIENLTSKTTSFETKTSMTKYFWPEHKWTALSNQFQLETINLTSLDLNSLNTELLRFFRKQFESGNLIELGFFFKDKKINLAFIFDYFIKPTEISKTEIENFKKSLSGSYNFLVYYGYVRKYPILVLDIENKEKVLKFNNLWEKTSMAKDLTTLFLEKNPQILYPTKKNFESKKINGFSYRILDFGNNYKIIWLIIDNYLIYSTTENGLSIITSIFKEDS